MNKTLLPLWIAALFPFASLAYTDYVNGIRWNYVVSRGEATIAATIARERWYNNVYTNTAAIPSSTSGAIVIPAKLRGWPVTRIGEGAFVGCSGLTSVTIPDSVTSIGNYAFESCSGLTSVTIPDSVTSIGKGAFLGANSNLFDRETMPGVWLVDGWATGHGPGLSGNLDLTGIRGIGDSAFYGCSGLTSVTIPDSVTSIGDCAFENCSDLTSVKIPDSVKSIGRGAFFGANSNLFDRETMPESELVDGWAVDARRSTFADAFWDPASASPPDHLDLTGCRGVGDGRFVGARYKSVTIPGSVRNIGRGAFDNCSRLESVTIQDGVKSIGDGAFIGCGLTNVVIPSSVTDIGQLAFGYCDRLQRIHLPATYSGNTDTLAIPWTEIVRYSTPGDDPGQTFAKPVQGGFAQSVTNLSVRQRYPWNGVVDIEFSLKGRQGRCGILVEAKDLVGGTNILVKSLKFHGGESIGNPFTIQADDVWVEWEAEADLPPGFKCGEVRMEVAPVPICEVVLLANDGTGGMERKTLISGYDSRLPANSFSRKEYDFAGWATTPDGEARYADGEALHDSALPVPDGMTLYAVWKRQPVYCVIDISGGSSASSYPVEFMSEIPTGGFNTEEYKTSKIVLKRIMPGTFIMGDFEQYLSILDSEMRPEEPKFWHQCEVKITQPYFMGLYKITRGQYELVMGQNHSVSSEDLYPAYLYYGEIRGSQGWPASASVSSTSFMGRIREKTGLNFDLPTEAQWDYAQRAGCYYPKDLIYNPRPNPEDDGMFYKLSTFDTYAYYRVFGSDVIFDSSVRSSRCEMKTRNGDIIPIPVGSRLPNMWGIEISMLHDYDMEHCLDFYIKWPLNCYGEQRPDPMIDPVGPSFTQGFTLSAKYLEGDTAHYYGRKATTGPYGPRVKRRGVCPDYERRYRSWFPSDWAFRVVLRPQQ